MSLVECKRAPDVAQSTLEGSCELVFFTSRRPDWGSRYVIRIGGILELGRCRWERSRNAGSMLGGGADRPSMG